MNSKRNLNGLDLFKLIMAAMVVAIHTRPFDALKSRTLYYVFDTATELAVPYFYMASAYLLFLKAEKSGLQTVKDYIFRMVKLYILWEVIYLPLALYGYIRDGMTIGQTALVYIREFFITGEHFYSWPLWYILYTVYAAAFVYLLLRCGMRHWQVLAAAAAVYVFTQTALYAEIVSVYEPNSAKDMLVKVIARGRNFAAPLYFSVGMCAAKYNFRINKKICALLLLPAFAVSVLLIHPPVRLPLFVLWFMLSISLELPDCRVYKYMRRASTTVYFAHMLVFYLWTYIVSEYYCYGVKGFAFTLAGSLVIAVAEIVIKQKRRSRIPVGIS